MTDGSNLLSVEGLTLQFGGIKPLDDVSFAIRPGELTAVIGPNGAGKTSLFNCLSGVYHPARGEIRLDGTTYRRLAPHKAARMGVARTFQTPALFAGLSVLENLMAARYQYGRSSILSSVFNLPHVIREEAKQRERAEEVIDLLSLSSLRHEDVGSLAYGVRKRVELARAICQDPKLLLLDEPMAGMTLEEKDEMSDCILDVQENTAATILLIEHDMGVVMRLAEHIVVLDFGRKIADGTPEEVRSDSAVIAAYLGEEPDQAIIEDLEAVAPRD
jgi:branched-chain amino acid transport system ATP-binding protein